MSVAATPSTEPTLGFTTLEQEVVLDELALTGELPEWLGGSLLRTGPAKFEVEGTDAASPPRGRRCAAHAPLVRRPGDAAPLHDRRRPRLLRQPLPGKPRLPRRARAGRIVYGEFATDPCRSLFKRVQTLFTPGSTLSDNANVNVARLGERFVAMTETPLPVQFDPHTLAERRRTAVRGPRTAHHRAPAPRPRKRRHAQLRGQARRAQQLSLLRLQPPRGAEQAATPRVIGSLPVKEPAYMHSFGLTERWLVLAEFPFVVNPLALALSGRPYIENYRWKPERGTRFTLVDRATGEATRRLPDRCRASPSTTSTPTRTATRWSSTCAPSPTRHRSRTSTSSACAPASPIATAELTRFRLRLSDRSVKPRTAGRRGHRAAAHQLRALQRAPLPLRVGRRQRLGRLARAASSRSTPSSAPRCSWSQPGCYPGEPVFVARPDADGGGRRRAAVGRARRRRRHVLPARARRRRSQRARARRGAAPHPVRLSRAVRAGLTISLSF